MKLAINNEVFKDWELENVISFCAEAGYDGIEIASPTFGKWPDQLPLIRRETLRNFAENHKIDLIGLNKVLIGPAGLLLFSPHDTVRSFILNYLLNLIDLCADLGGNRLIFDSPRQRNISPTQNFSDVWEFVCTLFSNLMQKATERNVTICFEALSPTETNFMNTVAETLELINQVNHPNFLLNLNFKAMCEEELSIPQIIQDAKNYIGHIHLDGPTMIQSGNSVPDLESLIEALRNAGYCQYLTIENAETSQCPEQFAIRAYSHLSKFI
ncbi:sugar phosphate isomerase/epimerase [candidate division KSB1 bacterium]|nr:sugar phosphate isomerase/epimerase [candidate division KSB1 bacterium]